MSFNNLSQEIVAIIVSHVESDSGKVASYAAISKPFQHAVEAKTFAGLSVTSEDLPTLDQALSSQPHRRALLGHLGLQVILPTYSDNACGRFERAPDQIANDKAFSKAIKDTFAILAQCDATVSSARPIAFGLDDVYSPMDPSRRGAEKYKADRSAYGLGKRPDLFEQRYAHSYLRLHDLDELPTLQRVTSLWIHSYGGRHLAPSVGSSLAKQLINLERINFSFNDEERKLPKLRTSMRQEFADDVVAWGPLKAKKLQLNFHHFTPFNQNYQNADVRGEGSPVDHFSLSLGRFMQSSNLVEVDLTGQVCIDHSLFTLEDRSTSTQAAWPYLKNFYMELSVIRPDGGWYLVADPELGPDAYDDDDEDGAAGDHWDEAEISSEESDYDSDDSFFDQTELPPDTLNRKKEQRVAGEEPQIAFRSHPTPEAEELYGAAIRAISRMPNIGYFEMFMKVPGCVRTDYSEQKFGFLYLAKGEPLSGWDQEGEDVQKHRLYWWAPRDWEMDEQSRSSWSAKVRDEGDVRYLSW